MQRDREYDAVVWFQHQSWGYFHWVCIEQWGRNGEDGQGGIEGIEGGEGLNKLDWADTDELWIMDYGLWIMAEDERRRWQLLTNVSYKYNYSIWDQRPSAMGNDQAKV